VPWLRAARFNLSPCGRTAASQGNIKAESPGFRAKPVSVEVHKQRGPVLRQSKGELAACMRHPESHAAAFRFFASLNAAASGLWNIK
jgi:hypothetical protein